MVTSSPNIWSFWPLMVLAAASWLSAVWITHNEVKGHFSFFTKLILGFSIAAFASTIIIYFVNGRSTSLSWATGGYSSTTSQISVSGSGGGMPWDGILSAIYQDLSKYVVIILGGIAFIVAGLTVMFADSAGTMQWKRRVAKPANDSALIQARLAQWDAELQAMTAAAPQRLAQADHSLSALFGWRKGFRHITPKLVTLPAWWPFHGYGAWSYMRYIIVSRELLRDAPGSVRRYVLGHESGHIRFGHTALNYMFPLTSVLFAVAFYSFACGGPQVKPLAASILLLLLIAKSALLWFPKRREFQADQYAAAMAGKETAIAGSIWMAHHAGDLSRLRQQRLLRLGYTGKSGAPEAPSLLGEEI
ncbi:M48 family metalloprotease [Acidithiobacillus caldus]